MFIIFRISKLCYSKVCVELKAAHILYYEKTDGPKCRIVCPYCSLPKSITGSLSGNGIFSWSIHNFSRHISTCKLDQFGDVSPENRIDGCNEDSTDNSTDTNIVSQNAIENEMVNLQCSLIANRKVLFYLCKMVNGKPIFEKISNVYRFDDS